MRSCDRKWKSMKGDLPILRENTRRGTHACGGPPVCQACAGVCPTQHARQPMQQVLLFLLFHRGGAHTRDALLLGDHPLPLSHLAQHLLGSESPAWLQLQNHCPKGTLRLLASPTHGRGSTSGY